MHEGILFLSLSLIIICVLTLVATGGRHKVNRTDLGQLEVELHAAGQIPNKMFPLFALLHSGKMFFVCFLFCCSLTPSVKSNKQINEIQKKKKKKKETELSPKDVRVSTRHRLLTSSSTDWTYLYLYVCARVCFGSPCVVNAPRGSSGHSDERRARRRRSFRSVSRFVFLNFSPTSLCCVKPLIRR